MNFKIPTRDKTEIKKTNIRAFIYGVQGSGKTYISSTAPDVLSINTDGNVQDIYKRHGDSVISLNVDEKTVTDSIPLTPDFSPEKFPRNRAGYTKFILESLIKQKNELIEKGYKTIVIDTIDHIFDWFKEDLLMRLKVKHENDVPKDWAYGRVEEFIGRQIGALIHKLFSMKEFNFIILGYEKTITLKGQKYENSILPKLTKSTLERLTSNLNLVARLRKSDEDKRVLVLDSTNLEYAMNRGFKTQFIYEPTWSKILEAQEDVVDTNPEKVSEIK